MGKVVAAFGCHYIGTTNQVKLKVLAGYLGSVVSNALEFDTIEPFLVCSGRLQNQDHMTAGDELGCSVELGI